jgi:hypothetical protein
MTVTLDYAIVGEIIEQLQRYGSWCGETHIQKTAFVAKEVCQLPLSATFVLYKHGPYSFDLNGILTSMRADRVLSLVPQGKYGPSFRVESSMGAVFKRYQDQIGKLRPNIERAAQFLGSKNVADLERVATAIYVSRRSASLPREARAMELNRVKPHISLPAALSAIEEADQFFHQAS